ncbi:hypothetical protein BGZ63DRAFT_451372 [Mariannaea sp. PMI_226]|nr:hypothetical protein BGZ63DRAFT_451372 [Mariannaea sp. PMI_226]
MDAPPPRAGGHVAPVFTQANFPRVRAEDRPLSQQAAFTEFYPNGLPIVYKMLETPGSQGVMQTYIEDYLPVGFYTNYPKTEAKAIFSTRNGARPFRMMQHLLPQRRIHLWSKDEIQSVCNSLRKIYWEHMRDMRPLERWDDLWLWFDASDLYQYGALNLWNVTCTLVDENKILKEDFNKEVAVHICHWTDEWAAKECNRSKLIHWEESQGPLLTFLDERDWKSLGNIHDDFMPLLSNALKHRRALIMAPDHAANQKPKDLVTCCRNNNLQNWLAGQKVFEPNGLPGPPETHSHHCSPTTRNAPPPVFMHNGSHYYMPPPGWLVGTPLPNSNGVGGAVEALQKSAAAAGTCSKQPRIVNGIVIANGSNRPLPPMPARNYSQSQRPLDVESKNPSETSENLVASSPSPPRGPAQFVQVEPDDGCMIAPMADTNVGPMTACMSDEYNALTPTKVKRPTRDTLLSPTPIGRSLTRSLPPSTVIGYSELATGTSELDNVYHTPKESMSQPTRPSSVQPRAE